MNIELYHCRDARSFRVLWALEELGLNYKLNKLSFPPRIKHKDFLDVNPLGTVPACNIDGKLMTESCAIVHYLTMKLDSPLHPDSKNENFPVYLDWLYRADATLTFPLTLRLRYSKFEPDETKNEQIVNDYTRWFLSRVKSVERALTDQNYLINNEFSSADICVGYSLFFAEIIGLGNKLGPHTQAYLARLKTRPAFQKAIDLQGDMELYL